MTKLLQLGETLFLGIAFAHCGVIASPERIYDTPYGRVACSRHELTPCGVSLSRCHDTRLYRCLVNVRWEDQ